MNSSVSQDNHPLVTVLMPLYNQYGYVAETIESVLQQTFHNFELLIIDDGSTDGSANVVGEFDDVRIKLISRPHAGLTATLNYGLSQARGQFIARIDSNDLMLPERLAIQFERMQRDHNLGIIGGQAQQIDHQGNVIGELRRPVHAINLEKYARYASPLLHSTFFMKVEVARKLNGYRDVTAAEDFDLLLRAIEYGYTLGNVPESIMKIRYSATGISESLAKTQFANTRRVIKAHKSRISGKDDPVALLDKMTMPAEREDAWFRFWYNCRARAAIGMRNNPGLQKIPSFLFFIVASLAHVELAIATWNSWKLRNHKY